MRIIKNNYEKTSSTKPIMVICEHCESEFEVEEDEINIGAYGGGEIKCPCCNNITGIDNYGITLNEKNVTFPNHFQDSKGAIQISDEQVTKMVRNCIIKLKLKEDEGSAAFTANGDTHVFVFKDNDEYWVTVCKNAYETYVSM